MLTSGAARSFEEAKAKLQNLGMVDYGMQGNSQAGYTFTGHFIYPQQPDKLKTMEGQGPTELSAMQAVIDKIGR
jgi:hypothetical protein